MGVWPISLLPILEYDRMFAFQGKCANSSGKRRKLSEDKTMFRKYIKFVNVLKCLKRKQKMSNLKFEDCQVVFFNFVGTEDI